MAQRWELLGQYFKPYAVCRWAQPAVEGALRLKQQHHIEAKEITGLRVHTFHEAVRLAVRTPRTTEEAQYSLPFPLAAMLVYGELGPEQLCGAALRDERVLRLARLVELEEERELTRQFPARRFAHVRIETRDGACREMRYAEPRWDAGSPPSDDELIAKFRRLTAGLAAGRSSELEQLVLDCTGLSDVTALAELMAEAR